MSGLIQRLLDRSGGPVTASAAPLNVSGSPLAAHDQRLQDPGFRNLAIGVPLVPNDDALDTTTAPPVTETGYSSTNTALRPTPPVEPVTTPRELPQSIFPQAPQSNATQVPMVDPIAALRAQAPERQTEQPVDSYESELRQTNPAVANTVLPSATELPAPDKQPTLKPLQNPTAATREQLTYQDDKADAAAAEQPSAQTIVEPQTVESRFRQSSVKEALAPQSQSELTDNRKLKPVVRETAEPEPQIARPAPILRPAPELPLKSPEPRTETAATTQAVERIVERFVAQEATTTPVKVPYSPPTAKSVSRIGQLPSRRRAHTLFGLRRG